MCCDALWCEPIKIETTWGNREYGGFLLEGYKCSLQLGVRKKKINLCQIEATTQDFTSIQCLLLNYLLNLYYLS